jgi:hypothetical protein
MAVDDSYTKVLLHANGADTSTTITDESGKSWTASNHAQIDTAQSKFGGASLLFDGSDDYVSASDSDDFYFDGDFSIDFWGRVHAWNSAGYWSVVASQYANSTSYWLAGIINDSGAYKLSFQFYSGGSGRLIQSDALTINLDTWYHFAICRSGNNYYFFQAGTLKKTVASTYAHSNVGASLAVGARIGWTWHFWNGHIDEFRLSKGIARWTESFTPPTLEYRVGGQVIIWSTR